MRRRMSQPHSSGTISRAVVTATFNSENGIRLRQFSLSEFTQGGASMGLNSAGGVEVLSIPANSFRCFSAYSTHGKPPHQPTPSVYKNGITMRGSIYAMTSPQVLHTPFGHSRPMDPRTSGMKALDEMITKNLAGAQLDDQFRSWICVNSGPPRSGKTKLLQLSCNHFVSSESDRLFAKTDGLRASPRPRHAIYITMNGTGIEQGVDANDFAVTRLYHRLLFALREERSQKWEVFMHEVRNGKFGKFITAETVIDYIHRIVPEAHVLIAADELLGLAPKGSATKAHIPTELCMDGLSGLNRLVRETCKPSGRAHIFLVASALAVVDLKAFTTDSATPFTFQPLEPLEPAVIREVFEKLGIEPDRRRDDSEIANGVLKYSTEMPILMAIHEGGDDCRKNVLAEIRALDKRKPVTTYIEDVHDGKIDSVTKVRTIYKLLISLFVPRPPSATKSFDSALHPALDAMCYDICRVIRRGGNDTVLMRPDVMKQMCDSFLKTPEPLRTPEQTAFVTATSEFASALAETVVAPNVHATRDFVKEVRNIASEPSGKARLEKLVQQLEKDPDVSYFADRMKSVIASGKTSNAADLGLIAALKAVASYPKDLAVVEEQIKNSAKALGEASPLEGLVTRLAQVVAARSAGKAFERLMKCFFRCLLLSGSEINLNQLFELPLDSDWNSAELAPAKGECPDQSIKAFPRAYDATLKRSEECDPKVLDLTDDRKGTWPCVFQPMHTYNLLLDVAVFAELISGEKMCFALQCKEHSASLQSKKRFQNAVAKWRNRTFNPAWCGRTPKLMKQLKDKRKVHILWVLVTVNRPPQGFVLKKDEALLSLDAAISLCPSLQFAGSASVVWSPGEPKKTPTPTKIPAREPRQATPRGLAQAKRSEATAKGKTLKTESRRGVVTIEV